MTATHWLHREILDARRKFSEEKSPRNHARMRELKLRAAFEVREIDREVRAIMAGHSETEEV